jgi:hypothetical protein
MSSPSSGKIATGNFTGTGILGAVSWFLKRYGPAAGHAVITKLSPTARQYVQPNAPNLGILAARKYPYPFIGELFRAMASVAKVPEDQFLRDSTAAGMDATLDTVGRIMLRWAVTPQMIAARAQELWRHFHDSGVVTVKVVNDNEYVSDLTDWPDHDVTVCKMCAEARRRLIERTGKKNVEVTRVKCVAWGHDRCTFKVKWSA